MLTLTRHLTAALSIPDASALDGLRVSFDYGVDYNYKSLAAVAHTPGRNVTPVVDDRGVAA